uniref:Uncharacterized protein n=1 Tax=Rhizophora mucronata TaxID=61149 RepID=A0A2P2KA33_RHIMU
MHDLYHLIIVLVWTIVSILESNVSDMLFKSVLSMPMIICFVILICPKYSQPWNNAMLIPVIAHLFDELDNCEVNKCVVQNLCCPFQNTKLWI